jgi:hypothetical protein
MQAKSIKGNSTGEIQSALQECMAGGFKPTLAFVFCSIKQEIDAIGSLLEKEQIALFGVTTAGEFKDGYEGEGSAVFLLLDMNPDYFTILFDEIKDRDVRDAARQLGENALRAFNKPAFILTANGTTENGETMDGESIVRGIEDVVGPEVYITGGTAGDDLTLKGSIIFTNGKSSNKAIMALVLDETKIEINGLAISGWKPVGITKTITKSEGGWIHTIDDKPALEVFLNYMGRISLDDDSNDPFYNIGFNYPLQIQKPSGSTGMCSPIMFNKAEGSLLCEFNLPAGTKFRFSLPPDFDIIEEVISKSKEVKTKKPDADALLIFSCAGRLSTLGPMANAENEGLQNIWGVPMAGFYCYGEFGRVKNERQEFHSTTISWAVLKEK